MTLLEFGYGIGHPKSARDRKRDYQELLNFDHLDIPCFNCVTFYQQNVEMASVLLLDKIKLPLQVIRFLQARPPREIKGPRAKS